MANSALTISDLGFASLKSNFITFLQSQTQFKGFNYTGPNLSALLDVLSYNSFINSFLANMQTNEMFLDSAVLRDSIVSHAKELNYTPGSYRSSLATVTLSVVPVGQPGQIIIPMGTVFNATSNSVVFTFTTDSATIITPSNGNYTSANVNIFEGFYVTESFLVNSAISNQRFILSNPQIDTTSLVVTVQASASNTTGAVYSFATSLLGYGATSNIYFLQAASANNYEICFGDGNIGNPPINGNIVQVLYRVASGDIADGIGVFTSTINSNSSVISVVVNTVANSGGGAQAESNASIQFYAPKAYETQERAITTSDYETILLTNFPEIDAINVYGGEELSPPQFGKVFIAINTNGEVGVSLAQAQIYQNFISTKNTVGITPVVIQPDFIYLAIDSAIEYNVNITPLAPGDISALVSNTIISFSNTYLSNFDITFRASKLDGVIDNTDPSITQSSTDVRLFRKLLPTSLNVVENYVLNFQNRINDTGQVGVVQSTTFTWNNRAGAFFQDDGDGNINIVVPGTNSFTHQIGNIGYGIISDAQVIQANVGSVSYANGTVQINNFITSQFDGTEIRVYIKPEEQNLSVMGSTFLSIANDEIAIAVTAVRE